MQLGQVYIARSIGKPQHTIIYSVHAYTLYTYTQFKLAPHTGNLAYHASIVLGVFSCLLCPKLC